MADDNRKFKAIFERLLAYFDKCDILDYSRVDVQIVNGKKHYFQVVSLAVHFDFSESESDETFCIYITTHDSEYGVNSLDELPKAWLDALIRELNSSRWSNGTLPVMPTVLANLKASSISGLELMLAIHGI